MRSLQAALRAGTSFAALDEVHASLRSAAESLKSSLWLPPLTALALAACGSFGSLYLDRYVFEDLLGSMTLSDPDAARDVLSVIATTMLTLTVLVFSITMVVLQLASAQYSPRVTQSFLRDRQTKFSLAVFLGTFAYSLVLLRAVRSENGGFVPQISLTITYFLVALSLIVFVLYLNHIAQSIRVSQIIRRLALDARKVVEALGDPESSSFSGDAVAMAERLQAARTVYWNRDGRLLTYVHEANLTATASRNGVVIRVVPVVGDFVPRGSALAEILGEAPGIDDQEIRAAFDLRIDRTSQQDLALGFRHLVDIAIRALSPGTNDPTTAVQALDHIHDLLRALVHLPLDARVACDERGTVRVIVPRVGWDALLTLAFTEIRHFGKDSAQVTRRLLYALDDLVVVAPPGRRSSLEQQRRLVLQSIERSFESVEDRRVAGCPDPQGLGSRISEPPLSNAAPPSSAYRGPRAV